MFVGTSTDPAVNLAAEELIFGSIGAGDVHFCVYINGTSVVIGKHQNPWRECNIAALKRNNIPVHRRISGGGTVYQDRGNLNFSFLVDRASFDKMGNLRLVARALDRIGIAAVVTGRGDILVDGYKVSGNALAIKKERVLHHGTLLVDADLSGLRGAITGQPHSDSDGASRRAARPELWTKSIDTHAVRSEPAPVENLSRFARGLTIEKVVEIVQAEFAETWGASTTENMIGGVDSGALEALSERNRSWSWNFGATPQFEVSFPVSPSGRTIRLRVRDATIDSACCADHPDDSCRLGELLAGARFASAAIYERCRGWLNSRKIEDETGKCGEAEITAFAGYVMENQF